MRPYSLKRTEEIAHDITALDLAKVILKAQAWKRYFETRRHWRFSYFNDDEDDSLKISLEDNPPNRPRVDSDGFAGNPVWRIEFRFELVKKDEVEFEYIGVVEIGGTSSTAYKTGRKGVPTERNFQFKSFRLFNRLNEAKYNAEWVTSFYRDLVDECGRMKAAENDLKFWAAANLDMHVTCRSRGCWSDTVLANGRVCKFVSAGISREDLRRRMVCKKCGTRNPYLYPV